MSGFQINTDVKIVENKTFLKKAQDLYPKLYYTERKALSTVKVVDDENGLHGVSVQKIGDYNGITEPMGKDDEIVLDFGNHYVGQLKFDIDFVGSPPDAPLLFEIRLGEMPVEVHKSLDLYDSWLSKSLIQQRQIHIDVPPHNYECDTRFAFRYLKIRVIDTSAKFKVTFSNIRVDHRTSADVSKLKPFEYTNPDLEAIDKASLKTLEDCMQEVFEDGPKRDRRLWLGDLYLQAQANYVSYDNIDLIKRCLYIFASQPTEQGFLSSCIFTREEIIPDDTYLADYWLHIINTVHDYYNHTQDKELVEEFWETMEKVLVYTRTFFNKETGVVDEREGWWSFFDWNEDLLKATSFNGIYAFTLNNFINLSKIFRPDTVASLEEELAAVRKASYDNFFDKEQGLFTAGPEKQISWHSQVWMILGGVVTGADAEAVLRKTIEVNPSVKLITPYAHHFLMEAMITSGMRKEASEHLRFFWKSQIDLGADTLWELYDPNDLKRSPYGDNLANSYCHAWSCTPTYFIRKNLVD